MGVVKDNKDVEEIDDLFLKNFSSQLSSIINKRLQKELEENNSKIREIESSNHLKKQEIIQKYNLINSLLSTIIAKNLEASMVQNQVIELEINRAKIAKEIETLLLKNGQ